MKDLIEEALDDTEDEKSGVGKIDDQAVKVTKEHVHTPKNREYWAVKVYFDDNEIPSSKETRLDADEAEDLFQRHVSRYDLLEGNLDQDRLQIEEEEQWWCTECLTEANTGTGIGPYCPNKDCEVGDGPELTQRKPVTVENCDVCSGQLFKSGNTVHAAGFADSYPAECKDCKNRQIIPAW